MQARYNTSRRSTTLILLYIVKNEGGFSFPGEAHRSPDVPPLLQNSGENTELMSRGALKLLELYVVMHLLYKMPDFQSRNVSGS